MASTKAKQFLKKEPEDKTNHLAKLFFFGGGFYVLGGVTSWRKGILLLFSEFRLLNKRAVSNNVTMWQGLA